MRRSGGSEVGSYLRLIDSCITQLKAQGPSTTCNESNVGEMDGSEGRSHAAGADEGDRGWKEKRKPSPVHSTQRTINSSRKLYTPTVNR